MSQPKILTVIGARPQFIKAAPISLAFKAIGIDEVLIHTGQHYDANMSAVFFEQLDLQAPQYHLNIGSGSHGYQTGEGLVQIEKILEQTQPDAVLVYGDTNATLAGALAAVKMHYPVAHIEAGLRSFNRKMPEEINRVMTDHVSQWLFAPTPTAIQNLKNEGIENHVFQTGDVMMDAICLYQQTAREQYPDLLTRFEVEFKRYFLLTMHRAETTANPQAALELIKTIDSFGIPVIFPVHPRMRPLLSSVTFKNVKCVEPLSYFEMLVVEESALGIITDSGGVQKEAIFLEVPCITLRTETEWTETLEGGWNQLVGLSTEKLKSALTRFSKPSHSLKNIYGDGNARTQIASILAKELTQKGLVTA